MNLFPLVANTIIVSVLVLSASAQTGYRISTVAGNGQIGSAGDGGPATLAAITSPRDFAIDGQGNYYIADTGNQFIRKITPAGIISIIAGNGFGTPIVDNVPAAQSAVPFPTGLAFDGHGNLYVTTLNRVRMITPQGYISTVAGTGVAGSTGDNGPALQATFSNLKGIVVDSAGAIFVSDGSNNRIRKIANGIVTTYAGTGGPFFSGDNGPATSATIWGPEGLALDATGNLYIADGLNHRVRKVTPAGTISTVAGNGGLTDPEEGAPATSGRLHWPVGITLDSNGNLFLTEWSAAKIKEVNPQG